MAVLASPLTSPLPLKRRRIGSNEPCLCTPLLWSNKAAAPTAVLESVVFSASAPTANTGIEVTDGIDKERTPTGRCIPEPVVKRAKAHRTLPAVVKLG